MTVTKCDFCKNYIEDYNQTSKILLPSHWCGNGYGKRISDSYHGIMLKEFDICKDCYNKIIKTLFFNSQEENIK